MASRVSDVVVNATIHQRGIIQAASIALQVHARQKVTRKKKTVTRRFRNIRVR